MNDARRRRTAKDVREGAAEETPLVDEVGQALADHPLELLGIASVIIEATRPDPLALPPWRERNETVDLDSLLAGFIGVPNAETTALLAALAEMLEDADLRARCRREVDARSHPLPRWLTELPDVEVYRAVRMTHPQGDHDEVLIGARLAGGEQLTCAVAIDHAGAAIKDGFAVADSISNVVRTAAERNTDPETGFAVMALTDARASLERGLKQSGVVLEPTDSWPACRPLLQWLTRCLPEGATPEGL
ncbi:hypothetical protein [Mycolicibacterium austroafricanum]|uniref:ESX secretion-associated protein EspG n=1 Tax=Mycolicibacterium austroafricanum TaxID=39687 RepID=A0ABT8H814_MYCAO|nr:hypothetical protein [Mycolicibacterium austroafricanum]MDN4516680.1 hypothetical protein [Mycolicibacterium austroafricanum]